MAQEVFGASQIALVASAMTLAGQAGWTQRDWEVANQKEFWEQMKLVNDGLAEIVPLAVTKPARVLSSRQQIISFYAKVFGLGKEAAAALKGMPAFKKDGARDRFDLILSPAILPDAMIIEKLAAWKPDMPATYLYSNLAGIKKLPKGHERPEGSYCIRHVGGAEPDAEHLGKSYDDAMSEGMIFLTYREYLIATIRNLWETGELFDRKGWTRTCSLWSDGYLVRGYCDGAGLRLDDGGRGSQDPGHGPRSAVIL